MYTGQTEMTRIGLRCERDLALNPGGARGGVRGDNDHRVRLPDGGANLLVEPAAQAELALVQPRVDAVDAQVPDDAPRDRLVGVVVADEDL
jgi:hypothetical protein